MYLGKSKFVITKFNTYNLDDSCSMDQLDHEPLPYETTRSAYVNLCFGNALGTFFSLEKSEICPTQTIIFILADLIWILRLEY